MSVMIYGVDEESKDFCCLAVASERNFYDIWLPVIKKLDLKYVGDQHWLYRKDLPEILSEFQQLYEYSKKHNGLSNITMHSQHILEHLEAEWNKTAPNADRLWMG